MFSIWKMNEGGKYPQKLFGFVNWVDDVELYKIFTVAH